MKESKASTKALIKKRDAELALMKPPPPPKRIKRPKTVVDEDTYLDGLSHIIARDYFPGLVQSDAKQEFLDAVESKDERWIQDARNRLKETFSGKTPIRRGVSHLDQTPIGFTGDTPMSKSEKSRENPEAENKAKVNLNLSLSAYQSKYTSEDNESFYKIMDQRNQKIRKKNAHLWDGNKLPSARQIAHREREAKLLLEKESTNALTLFYKDTRPAMPNYKKSDPHNTLMFMPDNLDDELLAQAQTAEATSNAPPKAIIHKNTRLEEPELPIAKIPQSPALSAIEAAVQGHPRHNESSAGFETPRVQGYSFVDEEPTEAELQAFNGHTSDTEAILSSLTTEIDFSPNPFDINDQDVREKLLLKLVDKNKSKARLGNLKAGMTPVTPKFKSAPKGNLTPAGKILYQRMKASQTPTSSSQISDFDLTPREGKKKKSTLLPGLTPKSSNVTRFQD